MIPDLLRHRRSAFCIGLLAITLAVGVAACAHSGQTAATPATGPATAAPAPAAATPPAPAPPPAAAAPSTPPAAAPAAAPSAAPPAGGAAAGTGGRGNPPPPPPPPPAVMPKPVEPIVSATAPNPDPRVGLKPGRWDAGQAAWNMRMLSTTPPTSKVLGATHSDLAFSGNYVIQGNYNG